MRRENEKRKRDEKRDERKRREKEMREGGEEKRNQGTLFFTLIPTEFLTVSTCETLQGQNRCQKACPKK